MKTGDLVTVSIPQHDGGGTARVVGIDDDVVDIDIEIHQVLPVVVLEVEAGR